MASSFTKHTIKLPDEVEISYTDSGGPHTINYTTLIILHGGAFNSGSFLQLHKLAHEKNLRIVLFTRRGHRGSSAFTDAEVEEIHQAKTAVLDRFALQLAWFIQHLIKNEGIPRLSADRQTGGIIPIGWSFGNAISMTLFSDPSVLPEELYTSIEPYLMNSILYDPPFSALGYLPPAYDSIYDPFTDTECSTPEEFVTRFTHWVSAYFEHSDIHSGKPEGLDYSKQRDKRSIKNWNAEQSDAFIEGTPASQYDIPMAFTMQQQLAQQRDNVSFDERIAASFFPNVQIHYISCDASNRYCILGWTQYRQQYDR